MQQIKYIASNSNYICIHANLVKFITNNLLYNTRIIIKFKSKYKFTFIRHKYIFYLKYILISNIYNIYVEYVHIYIIYMLHAKTNSLTDRTDNLWPHVSHKFGI